MKRFWSSNLAMLANQESTTSSYIDNFRFCLSINKNGRIIRFQWMNQMTKRKANFFWTTVMRIVQLVTGRSRYFNPSKNYWFSFNAFLISLIGLYFRCLSRFWSSNLATLANQESTTSSCIDNFRFCLSINKNGRIIRFQWMNQMKKLFVELLN
jgi:hypothetical protein